MNVRWLEPGARVGAERGDTVVCVSVRDGPERLARCLAGISTHTPDEVPILLCADPSASARCEEIVRGLDGEREVIFIAGEANADADRSVRRGLSAAAPADVVVLRSNCRVAEGWLVGLHDAAYTESRVATAGALPNEPVPERWVYDEAAAAVRIGSLRIHPRVQAPTPHCMFIRRSALELVGELDDGFARRCIDRGLCHVVADDVLVLGADPTEPTQPFETGPLRRSVGAARRALSGLSLLIDARVLSGPMNGTQRHVLELIAAVTRARTARVGVIVPPNLSEHARGALEALPDLALTSLGTDAGMRQPGRADVVHRPFQISTPADLAVLAQLADRLVLTHQDLISYHNPSYFRSPGAWEGYRRVTRTALSVADRVLFFSAHARADAIAEELVEPHRATVVHIGVDHSVSAGEGSVPPPGAAPLPEHAEMILCLGTDFQHKNRLFALEVLDQLRQRHGWPGWLVLAGPRAALGSSVADERRALALDCGLAEVVIDLEAVSEAEKEWLLRRSKLVLYPTVHEGFGLIPFEAADHGVPCLWARGTSLSETLPDAAAGILPWDAASSADQALELLRDAQARARNLDAVKSAAARLKWHEAAEQLIEVYHAACDEPPTPTGARERAEGLMRRGLSEDAMRLVGPEGALPGELERPLLALATHPKVGGPIFGAIKAGYQASYRWRRKRL